MNTEPIDDTQDSVEEGCSAPELERSVDKRDATWGDYFDSKFSLLIWCGNFRTGKPDLRWGLFGTLPDIKSAPTIPNGSAKLKWAPPGARVRNPIRQL